MTGQNQKIIIVEDEPDLAGVLRDYLIREGYSVDIIADGTHAAPQILDTAPALVILDLMLPGRDGLSIAKDVRAASDVPIIMATAKVEEIDRLLGLELGADDYVCKPYSPREVVARVKAILRRVSALALAPQGGANASVSLDPDTWTARYCGMPLSLTRKEFQLLKVMSDRPGRVFSRGQLLDLAYGGDEDVFDRTIDSHIKNLRRKLADISAGQEPIRSIYGVGYAFDG